MTRRSFCEAHQRVILDFADPIHRACDFLLSLDLEAVNRRLHSDEVWAPWPEFLVAFASNGCGDYFAFDTRRSPPSVLYVDPDRTPEESLDSPEALRYDSFEAWYASQLLHITCSKCRSCDTRFEPSLDRQWLLRVCLACAFRERVHPVGDDLPA
jgi:hypothetical protein